MRRLLLVIGLLSGCGSAPIQANHSHFESIQRQETRMDVAGNVAFDPGRACAERESAEEDACQASDRICEVAAQINDSDATHRCSDAQMRCRAIGASVSSCSR
jgi:hypothetical protein